MIILFLAIGAILLRDCIKNLKVPTKNKALQYFGIVIGICSLLFAIWLIINNYVLPRL